jgi:hypothetical protein
MYVCIKSHPQFPGLVLLNGQKLTLGLSRAYASFPKLLHFLKCILEVVFCECVQHSTVTSIMSKWRPFRFIFNCGNRKVGWVGDDSHVPFGEIFLWKRKRETVGCRNATASSFVVQVRCKVFAYFQALAVKRHSSMRTWLFGLPGWILCEQSPWCHRKW